MTHAEQITLALARLGRRRRRQAILKLTADGLALFGLWLGGIAVLDTVFAFGSRVRLGLAVLLAVAICFWLMRMALTWLAGPTSLIGAAREAEKNDSLWNERLMTAVTQMTLPPGRRASAALNDALLAAVADEVAERPPARRLPMRRVRRSVLRAAGVALIWLIAARVPGVPLATLVGRQVLPLAAIAPVSGVRIELVSTPPAIAQGESVTVEVTLAGGNVPAFLEVGPSADELRSIPMEPTFGQAYKLTLLSPPSDLVYRVRAGSARTPPVTVRVQRRPGVTAMSADIQTPDGRSVPWSPEAGTDLALVAGSTVRVTFRSTEPLRAAVVRSKQGAVAARGSDGQKAWQATLPVTADAAWDAELTSQTGLSATVPLIRIRAEP